MAGRPADEIRLDYKILEILNRLNYFDFYFVYSSAMLLIVLEVYFSLLFLNNEYVRACFVVCKIRSPFFSCRSLLLGTSISNDTCLTAQLYIQDTLYVYSDTMDIVLWSTYLYYKI